MRRRPIELARRVDSPHSAAVRASHLALIRSLQGRAGELEPVFAAFVDSARHPIARITLAWLRIQCGKHAEARRELRNLLARGLDDLPRDFFWLGSVALLGEVAAAVEARRPARLLYEALLPYADQIVVVGMSAGCLGSASRPLGLLAGMLGHHSQAALHFETALAANARLRAFPLLARTQLDFAAVLEQRGLPEDRERANKLRDEALTLRDELAALDPERRGLEPGAVPAPAPGAPDEGASLELEGVVWAVRYAGARAHVRDGRGMRYLALLLERPGEEIHALDLVARVGGAEDAARGERSAPLLDARARREYRERVADLRAELEAAEDANDSGRAEGARAELEAIERTLAGAFGLGGRARGLGDLAERARKAVYNRLRAAITAIEAAHPALGRHLALSVETGLFCAYQPDRAVHWRVVAPAREPEPPAAG